MSTPVVVLVAHGTADRAGIAVLDDLRAGVAARLPDHDVRLSFVDVTEPTPAQVLAGTSGAVVVPMFLASGYHVQVDIAQAVARADDAWASRALGAAELVVEAVADRVRGVDLEPPAVVLAAAGSSQKDARAEVVVAAERLAVRLGCPVVAAFLSGPGPSVPDALATLVAQESVSTAATPSVPETVLGPETVSAPKTVAAASSIASRVVVAPYLLAPGHFQMRAVRLAREHGVRCAAPIGVHPRIIDLVVQRSLQPFAQRR